MDIQLSGKKAIVTGAAHGIGRGIVQTLAAHGAEVWGWDILPNELELVKEHENGERIHTATVDVTDSIAIDRTVAEMGGADIFVHSAGGVCGQVGQPLENVTQQQFQQIFDVNIKGAFLISQAVVPTMKTKGWGRIVTISSGAGFGISLTGIQAYASAKAGQMGLVRQLAHELGGFGITVNSVAPGFIRSNPASEKQWHAMGEEKQKQLIDGAPIKRPGEPQDIANGVLFFVSDLASWVSGQTLKVSGGR